jgi:quinol monooxygenase YgiN
MLRFALRLEFEPSEVDEATQTLRSLIGPVRAEPGCSSTRLLTDMDGSGIVTWTEEWRGWEAFERHLEAKTFRRMVAVMELAVRAPTVEIDEVTERHGFELVEKIFSERYRGSEALLTAKGDEVNP